MGLHPRTEDTLQELPKDPRVPDVPIAKERGEELIKDRRLLVKMLGKAAK
jgi:hypothetical protein